MDAALSRLPHPVNSTHVQSIAETILRSAQEGERDPIALLSKEWRSFSLADARVIRTSECLGCNLAVVTGAQEITERAGDGEDGRRKREKHQP